MASKASDTELLLEGLVDLFSQTLRKAELSELFEVIGNLGSGTFGSVLMVKHQKKALMMAVKMLDKKKTIQRRFLMEYSLSFFLSSHRNVIGSYGLAFETPDHYAFAQELSPLGDLLFLIPVDEVLPEVAAKKCAVQISGALDFMHTKGLVHLDVKPENILVFNTECALIKITDFGATRPKGELMSWRTGTPGYNSPELCQLTSMDPLSADPKMDVWAFGMVLFLLLTGDFPWKMATLDDTKYRRFYYWQQASNGNYTPFQWNKLPDGLHALFHAILATDINVRGKVTDVLAYTEKSWKINLLQETLKEVGKKRKRPYLDTE